MGWATPLCNHGPNGSAWRDIPGRPNLQRCSKCGVYRSRPTGKITKQVCGGR